MNLSPALARPSQHNVVALNVIVGNLTDPAHVAARSDAATHEYAWGLACATGRYDHKATLIGHPQAPASLLPVYARLLLAAAYAPPHP